MNNAKHIFLTALAIFIILAAPLIPHHHHGLRICVEKELCLEDHTYNDSHTDHGNQSQGDHDICNNERQYTENKTTIGFKNIVADFVFIFTDTLFSEDTSETDYSYNLYIVRCKSVQYVSHNGLRAPPYPIV